MARINKDKSVKWIDIKSAPAQTIACVYNGQLVSADSWQIGIKINTAKGIVLGAKSLTVTPGRVFAADGVGLFIVSQTPANTFAFIPAAEVLNNGYTAAACTFEGGTYEQGADGISMMFCDLGQITGVGRLLMLIEYTDTGKHKNIWYSTDEGDCVAGTYHTAADIGAVWNRLNFTDGESEPSAIYPSDNSLRHWHGLIWCPDVGTNDGKLLLLGGDSDTLTATPERKQCALLVCDDVKDLLDNPNTWFARWGLGLNGRDNWTTVPPDVKYVAGFGDVERAENKQLQHFRIVGGAFDPVTKEFYWLPDQGWVGGAPCLACDLSTDAHTVRYIANEGESRIKGYGWTGLYVPQTSSVLLNIGSGVGPGAVPHLAYGAEELDIYALSADRQDISLVKSYNRIDYDKSRGIGPAAIAASAKPESFFEHFGTIYTVSTYISRHDDYRANAGTPVSRIGVGQLLTYRNLFKNPGLENWTGSDPDNLVLWKENAAHTIEQSNFTAFGKGKSIKTTIVQQASEADIASRVTFFIRPTETEFIAWRGRYITLFVMIYCEGPFVEGNGFRPALATVSKQPDVAFLTIQSTAHLHSPAEVPDNKFVGRWFPLSTTRFYPDNADWGTGQTELRILPQSLAGTGKSGIVYVSDITVLDGITTLEDMIEQSRSSGTPTLLGSGGLLAK